MNGEEKMGFGCAGYRIVLFFAAVADGSCMRTNESRRVNSW